MLTLPLFHAPPNLNFTQRTAHGNLPEGDDTGLDLDEDGPREESRWVGAKSGGALAYGGIPGIGIFLV